MCVSFAYVGVRVGAGVSVCLLYCVIVGVFVVGVKVCVTVTMCVLILLYVSSFYYMCPHSSIYVSSYDRVCV